ncbi:MAG: hypothetical protein QOF51_3615, partial [Chloroflexota bacterium]|nr:hypothetical protein [Chloroflexota bacterium]
YAAFLLLGVLIVALWHAWRRRAVHGVVLWLAAHAAIAALFAPWLPIFFRQAGLAASVEDWSGIAPLDAAQRWANATLADNAAGWGVPALVVLGGAVALGGWTLRTRSGPLAGLTLTIVVLPLVLATAASGFLHSFRERGFLAVIGAPWLLMVTGIAGSPRRWTRIAALVLTAGIAVLSLVGLRAHYAERKEDWRTAAALISQNGGPGDPIFLVHFAGEVPLDLYLTSAPPRVGLPLDFDWETGYTARYVVTPQDVEQRVPPALANASRAWAVLSHDQGRGSDYLIAALARWGQRSGQWQLNGVRVFRYDRR